MTPTRLQDVTLAERLAAEAKEWTGVSGARIAQSECEYLRALLAEAAAALSVRGWLPIEGAPKDGTRVIVTRVPATTHPPILLVRWGKRKEGAYWWMCRRHVPMRGTPTHWMPLPEPPATPPSEG